MGLYLNFNKKILLFLRRVCSLFDQYIIKNIAVQQLNSNQYSWKLATFYQKNKLTQRKHLTDSFCLLLD